MPTKNIRPAVRSVEERNQLVVKNLPLVKYWVGRLWKSNAMVRRNLGGIEDAIQVGVIGFMRAAELYEPVYKGKPVTFGTIARSYIFSTVIRAARSGLIHVPSYLFDAKYKDSIHACEKEAVLKVINFTGINGGNQKRSANSRVRQFDPKEPQRWEQLDHIGNQEEVANAMRFLNPQERLVIKECFWEGKNLKKTARDNGLTAERIRQIRDKALSKLRPRLTPA